MSRALFSILLLAVGGAWAADPLLPQPLLVANPEALETLLHPNCSHCNIENLRRKAELRSDDPVLCWLQVQADGYIKGDSGQTRVECAVIALHHHDAIAPAMEPEGLPVRNESARKAGIGIMHEDPPAVAEHSILV